MLFGRFSLFLLYLIVSVMLCVMTLILTWLRLLVFRCVLHSISNIVCLLRHILYTHGQLHSPLILFSLSLSLSPSIRHFNLRMKRDTSLFAPDLKVEVSGEEIPYDTSHIYTGEIYGKHGTLPALAHAHTCT